MGDFLGEAIGVVVGVILIVVGTIIDPSGIVRQIGISLVIASLGSAVGKLLADKPVNSALQAEGYKQLIRDPIHPRRIIYGTRAVSGPIVFVETSGDENKILHLVLALTTHPVEDITHMILNDQVVRISGSPGTPGPDGNDLDNHAGWPGDNYIYNNDANTFDETDAKWGSQLAGAILDENGEGKASQESALRIVKCNGWATAKNSIEHAGQDNIYIPNTGHANLNDPWFLEDVYQQKLISTHIKQEQINSIEDINDHIHAVDNVAYFLGGDGGFEADDTWNVAGQDPLGTPNNNRLTNCAYVYIRIEYSSEQNWRSSVGPMSFIVKGKRVYDPTDDSKSDHYDLNREQTTPMQYGWSPVGMTGNQRFDDPMTWVYTDNWGVCILDFILDKYYGLGARVNPPDENEIYYTNTEEFSEINWESFANSIIDSDKGITNGLESPDEITIPKYTINGVIETSSTPISIIDSMLTEGLGSLVYSEGQYFLHSGVYTPPDSADDIIDESYLAGDSLTISTGASRSTLFNKAAGIFVQSYLEDDKYSNIDSPDLVDPNYPLPGFPSFSAHDFPLVSPLDPDTGSPTFGLNPYEVEDGEEIIRDFDFPFCNNEFAAQRLAKLYLQRNRESLGVFGKFKPKIVKYKVGDTVYITNTQLKWEPNILFEDLDDPWYSGNASLKQFKIMSMTIQEDLSVEVVFQEEHSLLYDWLAGDALPLDVAANTALNLVSITALPSAPTWNVNTPDIPIEASIDFSADGTPTVTTTIKWNSGRGARNHPVHAYQVEYGIVTNAGAGDPAQRVAEWLRLSEWPHISGLAQGPITITSLDNTGGIAYEFRVRSISIYNRKSDWIYWIDSNYGDPAGFGVFIDNEAPPKPTNLIVDVKEGDKYLVVTVENDDNDHRDNDYLKIQVSKTIDDPLSGVEARTYIQEVKNDFSALTLEGRKIQFNVNPPDNDPWYFWASMWDTSGNGPTFDTDWFPALSADGKVGQLLPIADYYIKPLRGTGITDVSADLGLQAMIVETQTEPAALGSGNVKLYTASSIDPQIVLQSVPSALLVDPYLWDPITAGDIQNNLTVYLADATTSPYTLSSARIYDTVTLADITDPGDILNGFFNNVSKLKFAQNGSGGWIDTTKEQPHFLFYTSGVLQAEQVIDISLDQGTPQIQLIKQAAGSSNPGGGTLTYKVNGSNESLVGLTNGGASATLEVTYTTLTGQVFTITESWTISFEGLPGQAGPAGNALTIAALPDMSSFQAIGAGYIYFHGFDAGGSATDLVNGTIIVNGEIETIINGSCRAITTRENFGDNIYPGAPQGGYVNDVFGWLVFDVGLNNEFQHGGSNKNVGGCRKARDPEDNNSIKWFYDTGILDTEWKIFTPNDTMVVFGSYVSVGAGPPDPYVVTEDLHIFPNVRSLSEIVVEFPNFVAPNDVQPDAIDSRTSFVLGLRPPEIVIDLPVSSHPDYDEGDLVLLTTDRTLYRLDNNVWVRATPDVGPYLNEDPFFDNVELGAAEFTHPWFLSAGTGSLAPEADSRVGDLVIENDILTDYTIFKSRKYIPISNALNYRFEADVRRTTAQGLSGTLDPAFFYIGCIFYDNNKTPINYGGAAPPGNWVGYGAPDIYWIDSYDPPFTNTWQRRTFQFGPDTDNKIPLLSDGFSNADAKYVRLYGWLNSDVNGTFANTTHQLAYYTVREMQGTVDLIADSVTAGIIAGGAISADALAANLLISTDKDGVVGPGYNRVEIEGQHNLPFWIGDGTKTTGNARMYYDVLSGVLYVDGSGFFTGDISADSGYFKGDITGGSLTVQGYVKAGGFIDTNAIITDNVQDDNITRETSFWNPSFTNVGWTTTLAWYAFGFITINVPNITPLPDVVLRFNGDYHDDASGFVEACILPGTGSIPGSALTNVIKFDTRRVFDFPTPLTYVDTTPNIGSNSYRVAFKPSGTAPNNKMQNASFTASLRLK